MNRRRELQRKGLIAQRPPLDLALHSIQPGGKVLVKTREEVSLPPQREGPYVVLLTAQTAVRTAEKGWTHASCIKGTIRDKYLAVQFGPKGCVNHRVTRWTRGVPLVRGNCTFLWINVTNPTDQGWIFGKTWGIRYYEHGSDRGGFILIKKNTYSNETSPYKCSWRQEIGITLTQVPGKGRCVGTVPNGKRNVCNITENGHQSHNWLIPAKNTRWVCSSLGTTPCLSLKLLNSSHDFCVQVVIIPGILHHSEEYRYVQRAMAKNRFRKREPITALTLATLMILGAAGAGTGITSLVKQSQEFTSLRIAVDEDLARIEQSI